MEWALLLLIGLQGYFTIFRLTPESSRLMTLIPGLKTSVIEYMPFLQEAISTVKSLDQRLSTIETQLKMRAMDTGTIIEWLNKRDVSLVQFQEKIEKSLHLEEREKRLDHHQSEIIQLGKEIRLIREKK